jgi:hypothetical protein
MNEHGDHFRARHEFRTLPRTDINLRL